MSEFQKITHDVWQKAAETALRGQSIDSLTKNTYDDIAVKALYQPSSNHLQAALPQGHWQINQAVNQPNIEQAKTQIQQDLEQGVNALSLYSNQSLNALGYGLNLNQVNIKNLFQNTYLNMISLRLESGLDELTAANSLDNHYKNQNIEAKISLGVDPVGKLAQYGGTNGESETKTMVQNALKQFDATHILRADGRIAHNAGASEGQELAFVLSTVTCYLQWADQAGLDLNLVAPKIEICLSVSQNQFISIAKLRVMRQLWAELLAGLNIQQSPAYIYAETSYRMMSVRDPWVNMLRTTTACFSAGVGGADQIGILPLTAAIGLAASFERRMTRHIQTILIEESHLADVTDPSAGSGYIETLTANLTQNAWQKFQNIQSTDGIIANLLTEKFQAEIAAVAAKRSANLSELSPPLTGTSIFQIENEEIYKTPDVKKTTLNSPDFKIKITPLTPQRDAEMFEQNLEDK